jgi:hypothetical protein
VNDQERGPKVIQKLLETHNEETGEMKKGNKEFRVKWGTK